MARSSYRWSVTAGGWTFLAATLLVALCTVLSQANLLFFLLGLLVGAWVVNGLWSGLGLWGIEIRRVAASRALAGEATPVRYIVTRGGWLPMGAVVIDEGELGGVRQSAGYLLYLGRKGRGTAEALLYPERRGEIGLSRVRVRSSFPFGLTRGERWYERRAEILVYPEVYRVTRSLQSTSGVWRDSGRADRTSVGGDGDFSGLREYRQGDALRTIDWKRTARAGTLMVREHTRPVPPRVMICVDLMSGGPDEDAIERAVTLTASMACAAHGHGMPVGLVVVGSSSTVHRPHLSEPHRDGILETLARAKPGDGGTAGRAAAFRPSIWVLASDRGVAPRAPDLVVLHGSDAAGLLDTSQSGLPIDPMTLLASGGRDAA
ncbi:DUF58 domain-containing protein [Mucisphaera sp.]|uniref:DUF58 domain-containing protein n=1 Tax=Mucisphaera sp. TaxID=2913024 RepID=UPI003D0A2FFD